MLKNFIINFTIQALIYFSCAHNKNVLLDSHEKNDIYTIAQLQENKYIYNFMIKKAVFIRTKNDSLISGYFYQLKNDTLFINLDNIQNSIKKIPITQVKYIILKKDNHYKVRLPKILEMAIIVLLFAFFIISLKNLDFP